jgi:hypothetical protein
MAENTASVQARATPLYRLFSEDTLSRVLLASHRRCCTIILSNASYHYAHEADMRHARLCTCVIALLLLPLAITACVSGVNGSVDVPTGARVSDASTVNGSVRLETNAKADKATTVNGSIHLASGAQVGAAHTVNGDITLERDATV